MINLTWILLLYELPTKQSSQRVNLWRKLKKAGAVSLKTSAYLLPDTPSHHERFQWLAQQVRDAGGESTLIRITEIEGFAEMDVVQLFNEARGNEYAELLASLSELLRRNEKDRENAFGSELDRLTARFEEIRQIDFFDAPQSREVRELLQRTVALRDGTTPPPTLSAKQFSKKVWLTRPQPEIDRVGSAWLIRTFVDPDARFVFAVNRKDYPDAVPFDMSDVELSHCGEDCTFETLVKRFDIRDKAVRRIAEMVHDADLEDDKFHRPECIGIHQMLKGWARLGRSDDEILAKGSEAFDALYTINKTLK